MVFVLVGCLIVVVEVVMYSGPSLRIDRSFRRVCGGFGVAIWCKAWRRCEAVREVELEVIMML